MEQISTPCLDICRIEMSSGVCTGCGRTGEEISRWPRMTEPERLAIMARLKAEWRAPERPRVQYFDASIPIKR